MKPMQGMGQCLSAAGAAVALAADVRCPRNVQNCSLHRKIVWDSA